jgi:hypothetical protein
MALNSRQLLSPAFDSTKTFGVLRTETDLRSVDAGQIDISFFTRNTAVGVPGSVRVPAGYCWQRLASGLCRVLPIVKLTADTATNSAIVNVHCAAIFKVGEILQRQSDNAVLGTILNINADTNTITLAANAAAVMTAGTYLHVAGTTIAKPTTPTGPGVMGYNFSILDLDEFDDVAFYTSGSVYGARMPQSIADLNALFPMVEHS